MPLSPDDPASRPAPVESSLPATAVPTRVRHKVVGFMLLLGGITYLDRACIATLAPEIMRDLSLSKEQMSWVYSAFALSYAAFEIPTAWWADRQGTRRVLARIVVWWSAFTVLTGAAFNLASLIVARFLFGAGEAGAWPSVARTFSRWIPFAERGRVQGIFFAGAHLVGGLTPMIVLAITPFLGWRWVFAVFGLLGVVWAVGWYRWFRDEPAEHPQVNEAERLKIEAGRLPDAGHDVGWAYWKKLLTHPNTLPLCLMYIPNSFAFYFCITWLPTYLQERHGFDTKSIGFFAGLPLVLSVVGDLFGGVVCDYAVRRFGVRIGRAGVGAASYAVAGAAMYFAATADNAILAGCLFSVALAASMFMLAPAWTTAIDIGGKHAGVVSAAMNTAGQVGGILSPLMVTYALKATGDWNVPLFVIAGLFGMGALCWCVINPRKRIFE
ncbi:MAG TPA: MFS transporter [Opitutaceae bacterium]|nr:MFS transporter [Opitutaceae bacterium]